MESRIFPKLSSLQVRVGLFFCFPMHNGESITSNFFTVRCLLMLHDTAATNSCKSLTLLDFRLIKQHQWRKSQSISDILLSEALEYKWPHLGLLAPLHSRFAASIFAVHTKIAIQWRRKYQDCSSVICAPGNDLLARGPEQDGVFKLGRVAALDIAQRWVGLDDALFAQVLQGHQISFLAQPIKPATTEGQRSKVFVDGV